MSSLGLGLIAAFCWGLHDIAVRWLSRSVQLMAALFWVLIAGLIFHSAVIVHSGEAIRPSAQGLWLSVASGAAYLAAGLGLYYAFARGPVRLVAPIIGAYPMLSLGLAALTGAVITLGQIMAVLLIVVGVAVTAALSNHDTENDPAAGPTILLSILSSAGFAVTFKLGHMATELDGELSATLFARLTGLALLTVLMLVRRASFWPGGRALPVLAAMGTLDGIALLAVVAAGNLPAPELAAVASSMFGLFTVVLAAVLLKERMSLPQWTGCIMAFAGIGYLAL